jgi:hypothetical protein
LKELFFKNMSQTLQSAGYFKVVLSQVGDEIAIRTNDFKPSLFCINLASSSVFDGAEVGFYRNFTKLDGTIGDCEAPVPDGSGEPIVYTQPQAVSYSAIMPSNLYILRLLSVGESTNVVITINGINFPFENIITNLTVDSL